jgi:hypothetical protein
LENKNIFKRNFISFSAKMGKAKIVASSIMTRSQSRKQKSHKQKYWLNVTKEKLFRGVPLDFEFGYYEQVKNPLKKEDLKNKLDYVTNIQAEKQFPTLGFVSTSH